MKKVALVLIMLIFGLLPTAQPRENIPAGKELGILLNEIVTEYQAVIQDFIFEQKFLTEPSLEKKMDLLEERVCVLSATITTVETERAALTQGFRNGNVAGEEFAIEMKKLVAEVAVVSRSIGILGEKISETVGILPEDLQERGLILVEKFNQMAQLLSGIGMSIYQDMGEQGFEPPEMLTTTEPLEESESQDTGKPEEDTDTGKPEEDTDTGKPEEDTDTGKPDGTGKPEDHGKGKNKCTSF